MELKVIDVSTWQGDIDWARVKPQIDGAILRTGYGGDYPGQEDESFERNAKECTRLGIPFGVYHYSYADTEEKAGSEAAHIRRLIKPYKLSYPVYLDLEEENSSMYAFAPQACHIIGDIIEKAGYWFGVYANLSWWENHLQGVDKYTKWVAQYNNVCQYGGKHDIWQYSSTGKVNGISGNVDMNICYRDFPKEIGSGTNNIPTAPPQSETPIEPSNASVYYQTCEGSRWLPEVEGLKDYAGNLGKPISGLRIKASSGDVYYRSHVLGGNWLSDIKNANSNDGDPKSYSGIFNRQLDALQIRTPGRKARYRVHNVGRAPDDWCNWITSGDSYGDTSDDQAYAGNFGVAIDGLQVEFI